MNSRFNEKTQKYEQLAIHNGCKFVPAVVRLTSHIHHGIVAFIRQQMDYKLQLQNQQHQDDSTSSMLKVWIRKIFSGYIDRVNVFWVDLLRWCVDVLNSTQRDRVLLPEDKAVSS